MTGKELRYIISHLVCPVCGGPIPTHFPNGAPRCVSHGVPSFCSRRCKGKALFPLVHAAGFDTTGRPNPSARGANNPKWKGGISPLRAKANSSVEYQTWRRSVFERDDYTCQECGDRGGRLQAHHIEWWSENEDLRYEVANGKTLCLDCHRGAHRKDLQLMGVTHAE